MSDDLLVRRMESLGLARPALPGPAETVAHLLAVQSQDYGPAKWSLGQRTPVADPVVEATFAAGAILRTHVLRPTWHFVSPADLRWLLRLTGPRVHVQNAHYYRTTGLDEARLAEATRLIVAELEGGNHLTRRSLVAVLAAAGIPTEGFAAAYTLMHAELEGIICSGPLDGRQHTYALLEERVPPAPALGADEALAALVLRYFTSHGPATVKDLRWWSSVTLADLRRGLEMVQSQLESEVVDGVTYWSAPTRPDTARDRAETPRVHLLQAYDEYLVGYSESKALLDPDGRYRLTPGLPNGILIVDTELGGHWRRTIGRERVSFEVLVYEQLDADQTESLHTAADRQAIFLGCTAEVQVRSI